MRGNKKLVLAALFATITPPALQAQERPNIVFILVDDLGWTDVGFVGSDFYETPNIDGLAAIGVRFTNAYASATVCSPTRASLLTGKYPARLRVTDWIHGHRRPWARLLPPDWTHRLQPDETTIAEVLSRSGYDTVSIGKWHLGHDPPQEHGFDINIAGDDRGQPPTYHAPYDIPTLEEGSKGEYLTDRLTEEAITFMEDHRDRRFFLYLPYYTVHTPIEPEADKLEKYLEKPPGEHHRNPGYAAMIESLDEGVGRILAQLERLDLDDETVVIFTSDNGGLVLDRSEWGPVTSNAPLRAGKGSPYEGGVRVPLVIRWPGVTEAGRVIDVPVISADFYLTLAEIARISSAPTRNVDGQSLVSLLRGATSLDRDALYWHYPHYHPGGATPYGAIRRGDLKLIEFYEDERVELYDLKNDPGETTDLAESRPDQALVLRQALRRWRGEVGAQMPKPNPAFDPTRATEFAR